jgi:hypothetical protein
MKLVFYGTQRYLLCQQKPVTGPHLEPGEPSSQPHTLLHFIHLNMIRRIYSHSTELLQQNDVAHIVVQM